MLKLVGYLKDESGAAAAEYALLLAIIGAGIGVAVFSLGGAVAGKLTKASNCVGAVSKSDAAAKCVA